jgi:hypothetical protein
MHHTPESGVVINKQTKMHYHSDTSQLPKEGLLRANQHTPTNHPLEAHYDSIVDEPSNSVDVRFHLDDLVLKVGTR